MTLNKSQENFIRSVIIALIVAVQFQMMSVHLQWNLAEMRVRERERMKRKKKTKTPDMYHMVVYTIYMLKEQYIRVSVFLISICSV